MDINYPRFIRKFLLNSLCIYLLASTTQASSALSTLSLPLFVSVDAISLYAHPGSTQQINLIGPLGNTYVANKQSENDTTVMVGLGMRTFKNDWLQVNSSVRYIPMSGMKTEGVVWQLNSPQFDNLGYSYQIKSDMLLVDNIISYKRYNLQPGIILGVGFASNRAYDYQEWPLNNVSASSTSVFSDERTAQFAYELGVEIDYTFKKIVIESAYRFIDAGRGQLGLSPLQNTTEHLSTGELHYNTFSIGLRLYYDV